MNLIKSWTCYGCGGKFIGTPHSQARVDSRVVCQACWDMVNILRILEQSNGNRYWTDLHRDWEIEQSRKKKLRPGGDYV